jgi:hypothetical protein
VKKFFIQLKLNSSPTTNKTTSVQNHILPPLFLETNAPNSNSLKEKQSFLTHHTHSFSFSEHSSFSSEGSTKTIFNPSSILSFPALSPFSSDDQPSQDTISEISPILDENQPPLPEDPPSQLTAESISMPSPAPSSPAHSFPPLQFPSSGDRLTHETNFELPIHEVPPNTFSKSLLLPDEQPTSLQSTPSSLITPQIPNSPLIPSFDFTAKMEDKITFIQQILTSLAQPANFTYTQKNRGIVFQDELFFLLHYQFPFHLYLLQRFNPSQPILINMMTLMRDLLFFINMMKMTQLMVKQSIKFLTALVK